MATTAIQSRTASIIMPSIHLGSFSPYPDMANDEKDPLRFSDDNTVPVIRDENGLASYSQQRKSAQWRSQNASYPPAQPYSYTVNRTASATSPSSRKPPQAGSIYSSVKSPAIPVQPPNSPAQVPGPPREVCVECMMRDEDMADVDVTGPGVWDRESDIYYHELCQREEEEERDRDPNLNPNASSGGLSSSADCSRPRARGGKLTEGNLKVWLSMNPREPSSKHQTLTTYLDAQNALLLAESKARLQAMKESRQLDDKMRDAYSELRRSAYDLGTSASAPDDGGVKIRSPSGGAFGDETRHHKRETTLLENGMIVERVDVRKAEARMRKEERRARKASRDSAVDNRERERDATSLYSFQAAEGAASLRAPYDSSMSIGMPTSRSVRSMYTTPSSSWQPPVSDRPMSMAPGLASQTSLDSSTSPRRRFFGMKQWSGYFGSNASLVPSGSMVDMHLGLDQEKNLVHTPHVDIGSNAPSLREAWPRMDDGTLGRPSLTRACSDANLKKKKRRGLGRLWKIITGSPNKAHELAGVDLRPPHEEEEDLPLAPPPPLSYLVNRGSTQSERSVNMVGQGRHVSMPSLTLSSGAHHPRSSSVPSGVGVSLSSPSDQSSILPSPTEVRFPYYPHSSGDEREDGACEEDADQLLKKQGSLNMTPLRSNVFNTSEPDLHTSSPLPMSMLAPPLPQPTGTGNSSSSLVSTIKIPPVPPIPPIRTLILDKSLPPLPHGAHEPLNANPPPDRPRSFVAVPRATLPMVSYGHHPRRELSAPNPGFQTEDAARRQSFNGLASRPSLPRGAGKGSIPGMRYDDFGASRHSVAVFEPVPSSTTKRKSRFGFGSLLGRNGKHSKGHRQHASVTTTPSSRSRQGSFDAFASQVPAPTPSISERSLSQQGLSTSRRPLDELVPREPDFVAYRYPSKDERLDLSRN